MKLKKKRAKDSEVNYGDIDYQREKLAVMLGM
jgi:hypothetical protein